MERFENLAKKLFSMAKKDIEKAEETAEEIIAAKATSSKACASLT
jgi:hypothetical protein